MNILETLSFITLHPLNKDRKISALYRFIAWQITSRVRKDVTFHWVENSKLVVRRGMTGATGNIYCGLHEYEDMHFLLHLLDSGDLFVDVGANIGSYSILASKVCGSEVISIEPDPNTVKYLDRNIEVNEVNGLVSVQQFAVGASAGFVGFTLGRDTMNQVLEEPEPGQAVRRVEVKTLDEIVADSEPVFIKLDVEGYENQVLQGAAGVLARDSLLAIAIETVEDSALSILSGAGFQQYAYDPLSRKITDKSLSKASNSLFIRDLDAVITRLSKPKSFSFRGARL